MSLASLPLHQSSTSEIAPSPFTPPLSPPTVATTANYHHQQQQQSPIDDPNQPTVKSSFFASPPSPQSLPSLSTTLLLSPVTATVTAADTTTTNHLLSLSVSGSNNPELSTLALKMSSGRNLSSDSVTTTTNNNNDPTKTIVSGNDLNYHHRSGIDSHCNGNNDIFAYRHPDCYLESWQPPHPEQCNPGHCNSDNNADNADKDCFEVTTGDEDGGCGRVNQTDDDHNQHHHNQTAIIVANSKQDELLFSTNSNFDLISTNSYNNNLSTISNMLNLSTESPSSLPLSLLNEMKSCPFSSFNSESQFGDSVIGSELGPSSSIFSAFSNSSEMFSSESWPREFTTAVDTTTLVASASVESADSSYDSDQDSSNTNQQLKKFVVDLVDSGNSTTPDGEDNVGTFDDDIPSITANQLILLSTSTEQQPQPLPIKLISSSDVDTATTLVLCNNLPNSQHFLPVNVPSHDEINRTISETLQQEYSEYVTRAMFTSEGVVSGNEFELCNGRKDYGEVKSMSSSGCNTEESVLYDPEIEALYRPKLEFALKLGYTERQLCLAISKLGYNVEQNDLLAELISIGSQDGDQDVVVLDDYGTDEQHSNYDGGDDEPEFSTNRPKVNLSRPAFDGGSTLRSSFIKSRQGPRPIVIDGSNVAISHGNKEFFSCRGIQICVDWFRAHGHTEISVFVPMWRKSTGQRFDLPIKDRDIMLQLETERILFFTPSRYVDGRLLACYDDRYILNLALKNDGIIVSNDNYRDLMSKNSDYKMLVEERLLMYTFVNDEFMPPDDPQGRRGPSLQQFLHFPSNMIGHGDAESGSKAALYKKRCPYDKKCTYGNKCKYYHPGRSSHPQKSVVELIAEKAKQNLKESNNKLRLRNSLPLHLTSSSSVSSNESVSSANATTTITSKLKKLPLARAKSSFTESSTTSSTTSSFETMPHQKSLAASTTSSPARNLHRKLERQLTLNPDSDPRLQQLLLTQATQSLTSIVSLPALSLSTTTTTTTNNRHTNLHQSKSSSPLRCQNFLSVAATTSTNSTSSAMKEKLCKTKSCGNSFDRPAKMQQQQVRQIITNSAINQLCGNQPKQQQHLQNVNKRPIVKSPSLSMPITGEFNCLPSSTTWSSSATSSGPNSSSSTPNPVSHHHSNNHHPHNSHQRNNNNNSNNHHQNQQSLQFVLPSTITANSSNFHSHPLHHNQNSVRYPSPKGNHSHSNHSNKNQQHHQQTHSQSHQKLYHSKSFSTLSTGTSGYIAPNSSCRVTANSPTLTITQLNQQLTAAAPQPPKIYSKNVLLTTTANSSDSSVASSLSASSSILCPSSQNQLHQLSLPLPLQSSLSPLGTSHQQLYHNSLNSNGFNQYNHNVVTRNVSAPESTNSAGAGGNNGLREHHQSSNIHKPNKYLIQSPNLYPNSLSPPCPPSSSSSLSPSNKSGNSVWVQSSSTIVNSADPTCSAAMIATNLLNASQIQQQQLQQQERRNKIYFHLSSLFPTELVYRAMSELPDETNPQLICAAILKLQQK